jgi:putative endonuclease
MTQSAAGERQWLVYLLQCFDGTFYCGSTNNLDRRLAQHNGDIPGGARYTQSRRPVELMVTCACADRGTALRLEALVKKRRKPEKAAFLLAQAHAYRSGMGDG